MECVHKKTILNPKRYFNPVVDKPYLDVPCLNCEACRTNMQNEWAVRSYFEYLDTANKGGFSLMLLFTYSDKCVPRFNKISDLQSSEMCFNSHDVKRFVDSMSKYFKRRGESFKYMICSEYGDNENFTLRPHLHGVLNFITSLTPLDVLKKVRSLWHYGMVSPFKHVDELIVRNFHAITYSMKYTTKDLGFFKKKIVQDIVEKGLKQEYRHCLPNRYTSYQYGRILEDLILNGDLPFEMTYDGIRFQMDEFVYKVPRYIVNKLCFYYVPDGVTSMGNIRKKRLYTDFGLKYERFKGDKLVDKLSHEYERVLDPDYVSQVLPRISSKLDIPEDVFKNFMSSNVDMEKLAKYSLFCANRCYPKFTMELANVYEVRANQDIDLFVDNYFDNLGNDTPAFKLMSYEKPFSDLKGLLYNFLPVFKNYDYWLSLFLLIKSYNNDDVDKLDFEKNIQLRHLKEYLENVS